MVARKSRSLPVFREHHLPQVLHRNIQLHIVQARELMFYLSALNFNVLQIQTSKATRPDDADRAMKHPCGLPCASIEDEIALS